MVTSAVAHRARLGLRLLATTLVVSALSACDALEGAAARVTDRSTAFAGLAVGASGADRTAVLAAMGTPKDSVLANAAGYEIVVMTFEDCKTYYAVTLYNNRTWSKFATPRSLANNLTNRKE